MWCIDKIKHEKYRSYQHKVKKLVSFFQILKYTLSLIIMVGTWYHPENKKNHIHLKTGIW